MVEYALDNGGSVTAALGEVQLQAERRSAFRQLRERFTIS